MPKNNNILKKTKDTVQDAFSNLTGSEDQKKGGERGSSKKRGRKSK